MKNLWLGIVLVFTACGGGAAVCAQNSDCGSGSQCVFAIADKCAAEGQCVAESTGIKCNAIEALCGCDGKTVISGCGFPSGYASGPTTGASTCTP